MIVRIGTVTNLYPSEGKVRVLYSDRNETSVKLPLLSHEYKMPEVGKAVATVHMVEGRRSSGFVLGEFWSDVNKPKESGEKLFRQELGEEAYIRWEEGEYKVVSPKMVFQAEKGNIIMELKDGEMKFISPNIVFQTAAGTITVEEIIKHIQQGG